MKCIFCGAEIADNAKHCAACGREQSMQDKTAENIQTEQAVPSPTNSEAQTTAAPTTETAEVTLPNVQSALVQNASGASNAHLTNGIQKLKTSSTKTKAIIGGVFLLVIVLIIVIAVAASGSKLESVYDKYCNPMWASLLEDGDVLYIDTNPYDEEGQSIDIRDALKAINEELGFSEEIFEKQVHTSSTDGVQCTSNNKYTVVWQYDRTQGLIIAYADNDSPALNGDASSDEKEDSDSGLNEFLAKYPDALQAREVKYNPLQCLGKNFVLSGRAELDDYYNYDYRGLESVYFCIHVTPEGGSYADSWYIYADRSSKSELYEQLMNGTISDITLICKGIYPDSLKEEMANLTDYYIG